jgi:hypothetical protein
VHGKASGLADADRAAADRQMHRPGAGGYAELALDLGVVAGDRARAQAEPVANLGDRLTFGDQASHLKHAHRQRSREVVLSSHPPKRHGLHHLLFQVGLAPRDVADRLSHGGGCGIARDIAERPPRRTSGTSEITLTYAKKSRLTP